VGDFEGVWTGQITLPGDGGTADVRVEIRSTGGTYQQGDCDQPITLNEATDKVLDITVVQVAPCPSGDATLRLTGPGELDFVRQEGGGAAEYKGILRKS
jgi:hypothetical protein